MQLCNMAEIEKEEVEFPACATLLQGNLHKVAAPYFLSFIYIHQLYKEDRTILRMLGCQAVALPSTEQIALLQCCIQSTLSLQYFNSNTVNFSFIVTCSCIQRWTLRLGTQ